MLPYGVFVINKKTVAVSQCVAPPPISKLRPQDSFLGKRPISPLGSVVDDIGLADLKKMRLDGNKDS